MDFAVARENNLGHPSGAEPSRTTRVKVLLRGLRGFLPIVSGAR